MPLTHINEQSHPNAHRSITVIINAWSDKQNKQMQKSYLSTGCKVNCFGEERKRRNDQLVISIIPDKLHFLGWCMGLYQ